MFLPIITGISGLGSAIVFAIRQKQHTGSIIGKETWAEEVDMSGKYVVITGASVGLGFETARAIARMGADVGFAGRSRERTEAAMKRIVDESEGKVKPVQLSFIDLDLDSLASVKRCAETLGKNGRVIDVLICNAGVASPGTTSDNFPTMFQSNHLSHFYLTQLLLKSNLVAPEGRIVVLSSDIASAGLWDPKDIEMRGKPYEGILGGMKGYASSKMYNLLFVAELERRLKASGSKITTYAIHPGFCKSELTRNSPGFVKALTKAIQSLIAKSTVFGAQTTIHCATSPSVITESGQYFDNCRVAPPSNKIMHEEPPAKELWAATEKILADRGFEV